MRRPMPKFRRVPARNFDRPVALASIKNIFGVVKPRFFSANGNNFFAVGRILEGEYSSTILVSKLNNNTRAFEFFASSSIAALPNSVHIAGTISYSSVLRRARASFNIFRLFLNETIAFAKARKVKKITLSTNVQKLREYYESFGFKFDETSYGELDLK